MESYRQGEILFIPVQRKKDFEDKVIKNHYNLRKKEDMVIREGEVTGHLHEVVSKDAELYEGNPGRIYGLDLPNGDMLLIAKNGISITHPEHKTLTMPKGDYVIRIQREYDEAEQHRRVMD